MDAETEQLYLDEIVRFNAEYWADSSHKETQERLIKKFGSREKAIEKTFTILWTGFRTAITMV